MQSADIHSTIAANYTPCDSSGEVWCKSVSVMPVLANGQRECGGGHWSETKIKKRQPKAVPSLLAYFSFFSSFSIHDFVFLEVMSVKHKSCGPNHKANCQNFKENMNCFFRKNTTFLMLVDTTLRLQLRC